MHRPRITAVIPLAMVAFGVAAISAAPAAAAGESDAAIASTTVVCVSKTGERKACEADTSGGVALQRSTGEAACLLGKTWGYDEQGVWVREGCGGEFVLGRSAAAASSAQSPAPSIQADEYAERPNWGVLDTTGYGFLIGRTKYGELKIGGYALVRYINQLPANQDFTDHLGNTHVVDTRNDIQFHRAMLHFKGWLYSPKFRYQITSWTVMSTDQTTLYGFLGYQFDKKFNLYAGTMGIGGTRSIYGSHPLWLANDRVMADEFFRGSFTNGIYANGEVAPGLWYQVAVGNNLSQLGITAKQLNRDLATGGTVWWMPTTQEFGPLGAYGDWEYHERVATRFGFSTARSQEDRQQLADNSPENTQVRLADSLALFDTGSLAPGVTVQNADVRIVSFDAGMKYRGIFLQTELYARRLENFDANGPLPVSSIKDNGFYVQAAFFPVKKKIELYTATSWIFGDDSAGFSDSHEYILGGNIYWFDTRNVRTNIQLMQVYDSPVNSTFGFYVGGQTGPTISVATSFLF
ncbi:MAG: DUF3011 domain-containing protein [Nitrospirota bacterium]